MGQVSAIMIFMAKAALGGLCEYCVHTKLLLLGTVYMCMCMSHVQCNTPFSIF